ncbi:MAG: acetyl-CoA carboxylase biotin carboxylase subunit [Ectothiorhodospiraceae bacterium]|nr:acetyl-CoA carboxylase biotin carboxylase subunit [Ectothiorhodospiraceae bacterium]
MSSIKRVFVANRGEIAVRIIRACHALGIEAVVGVSEADRDSLAAQIADRAICIGPAPSQESYLRPELLVTAARGTGCQAVHPGYGFLSERAVLPRACAEMGLTFIGPTAEAIEIMGDKLSAIQVARKAGVPVVPGSGRLSSLEEARAAARAIGFPCLLKASAGGGGRGMRVVRDDAELAAAYSSAQSEAQSAFGDATVYLEKFVERARHIEIQVMGDQQGNVCHLFERDCTVQRRHQKLIEEAPSPALSDARREEMAAAAVALARQVGYVSAGTVEFVYDVDADCFYFLEMNTRIQVEHPVTEMATGIDLVREQILVADGESLSFRQEDICLNGHAIECRINAEDPARDFAPSPGRIERWGVPEDENIRLDSHCYEGYVVPPYYDSMIGKMIVWGKDRENALRTMSTALEHLEIGGITTTVSLHKSLMRSSAFQQAAVTTRWLETEFLPEWKRQTQETTA